MESELFFQLCNEKFSYLTEEFGFSYGISEDDITRPCIIFEKTGFKLKIINHVIEAPSFPIVIYIIVKEKKLINKFLKKEQTYDLDDLLIYRKCNTQVYEYLNYENIDSFYEQIPAEKLEYYKDKYSSNDEIIIVIEKYARLLRNYGQDVLTGNYDILPKVKKLRKEYDEKYNCGSLFI
ncbi:hypothetical protein [Clostridium sp. 'White wine YQ']|uniref:hypothetical protein n=1 Tax=Clostridium sp. 'White wine YQ' TaxID=3027474 RepID=UPI002365EE87|nr:hypothetical protein [Clostridium sp. 'White wine YQ']MDD7794297.1 hypothetical protein [Clostridium sp. 'White wine YQ']